MVGGDLRRGLIGKGRARSSGDIGVLGCGGAYGWTFAGAAERGRSSKEPLRLVFCF
jgi:hypothetical protein